MDIWKTKYIDAPGTVPDALPIWQKIRRFSQDIAALSMAKSNEVAQEASVSVMKMAMDL